VRVEAEALLVTVDHVTPSSDRCTRYAVIVAPPIEVGAFHVNFTCPLPGVATSPPGAPATVRGFPSTVVEDAPVPTALIAATRNRYVVPFASPVAVYVRVDTDAAEVSVVQLMPSSDRCTR
jgi:hypothetical protein